MVLEKLNIFQFRNYDSLELTLNPGINIIYGKNAQGKTNLLESIYVLAFTKSHRSFIDNNLIKTGKKNCKIHGTVYSQNIPMQMEIMIGQHQKKIKIDQNEVKRMSDYISKMNIIIFYPEDLELVKGSPGIRRRFLNLEISQMYPHYLTVYNEYTKILKMRNDYLKQVNKGLKIDESYFEILNKYFVEKAVMIYQYRLKFIKLLNENCPAIFQNLSGLSGLKINYHSAVNLESEDVSEIQKSIYLKMDKVRNAEFHLGTTLVGPHRDDMEFYLNEQNVKFYGSQGQQRMVVLAIKLAEINIFYKNKDTMPILLLDDVFSELDDQKKNNLLSYIKEDVQTIITTTDLKNIDNSILDHAKLIEIEDGKIINMQEEEKNGTK